MESIGELLEQNSSDPRVRLELGQRLQQAFAHQSLPTNSTVLNQFCDVIVSWLSGSNYKVALVSLDILDVALGVSGELLVPYLVEHLNVLMERLGDRQEQVRQQTLDLLVKFMHFTHSPPSVVMEKLMGGFNSKQFMVRVGVMNTLQQTLKTYGPSSLQLNKFTPLVAKLLADPNVQVRDTAMDTLVEMYLCVGDRLAQNLHAKRLLPENKAAAVFGKFEEAKKMGLINSNGEPLRERCVTDFAFPTFKSPAPVKPRPPPSLSNHQSSTSISNSAASNSRSISMPPNKRPSAPRSSVVGASRPKSRPSAANRSSAKHDGYGDHESHHQSSTSISNSAASNSRSISMPPNKRPSAPRSSVVGASRPKSRPSAAGGAGSVTEDAFYAAFDDFPKVLIFSPKDVQSSMENVRSILDDTNNDWNKRVDALKKLRGILQCGGLDYMDVFLSELRLMEIPLQTSAKDLRSQVSREACFSIAFIAQKLGGKADHMAETIMQALIMLIMNSAKVTSSAASLACKFILTHIHSPKLIPIVAGFPSHKNKEIRKASYTQIGQILTDWTHRDVERHMPQLLETIKTGLSDADAEARKEARKAYQNLTENYETYAETLFNSLEPSKQRQLKNLGGEISASSSTSSIAGPASRISSLSSRPPVGVPSLVPGLGNRSTSDIDTSAARRVAQRYGASARHRPPPITTPSNQNSLQRPGRLNVSSSGYGQMESRPSPYRQQRTPSRTVTQSQPGSRSNSPTSRYSSASKRGTPTRSGIPIGRSSQHGSRDTSPSTRTPVGGRRFSSDTHSNGRRDVQHGKDIHQALVDAISRKGGSDYYGGDFNEAIGLCKSTTWNERKEGITLLHSMFNQDKTFSAEELEQICSVFSRMFVDPHNKTFSIFLDALCDFVVGYRTEITHWLYVLLTRLLLKSGGELLASVVKKLNRALDVVRDSFSYKEQFNILIRFILDNSQTPSLKVKSTMLNFMRDLIHSMEPDAFKCNQQVIEALQKITHWTMEPKSTEVRKASQGVIIALFSLNASEFSAVTDSFPKSYNDMVYRLLQSDLKSKQNQTVQHHQRSPGLSNDSPAGSDFQASLRETTAEINNWFSNGNGESSTSNQQSAVVGHNQPKGTGSQDSGIVDAVDAKSDNDMMLGLMANFNSNPDPEKQEEIMAEIMGELSNHNTRTDERVRAMQRLKQMTRDGTFTLWDEYFKPTLLILLETLGDNNSEARSYALKVIRELCLCEAARFRDTAELTLLKVLEVDREEDKEVGRSAEECGNTLATHLPPAICFRVLNPTIKQEKPPGLNASIKMMTKVLQQLNAEEIENILPDVVPGIVKAYDNNDSSVRKASVLCLVTVHNAVGPDKLEPFLQALPPSKMKLLNLYIKRNQGMAS